MRSGPTALYLIAAPEPGLIDRLRPMLSRGAVSTLLLEPGPGFATTPGAPIVAGVAPRIVAFAQNLGVAVLIADDASLAARLEADGVHLTAAHDLSGRLAEARAVLGASAIVGVDAGRSRHMAMEAGERGADYVAFHCLAAPIPLPAEDPDTGQDRGGAEPVDLVEWWSEIFVVPCVAFEPRDWSEAVQLACAGADFVALRLPGVSGDPHSDTQWFDAAIAALDPARHDADVD